MMDEIDEDGRLLYTGEIKRKPNMPKMRSFRKAMDANEYRKSRVNNIQNQDKQR